jgi:hypothetical protein
MARRRVPKIAADLIGRGFKIFPIICRTKDRIPVKWGTVATDEPAQIEVWAKEFPGCNWGIALDETGHTVVDIDVHDGQDGPGTVDLLELVYGPLPPTLEAKTPSGGRHLFYKGACGSQNHIAAAMLRVKKTGVDVKSRGGYVVGAGSKTETGVYGWIGEKPIADLPTWIAQLVGEGKARAGETNVLHEDEEADIERARRWLRLAAPPSVEGEGGDDNAYRVACQVRDFGLSEDACLEAMLDWWNDRCEPPWDTAELAKKVKNAYSYARSDQGSRSPFEDFADDPPPNPGESEGGGGAIEGLTDRPIENPLLVEMNTRHAKVGAGGKVMVMRLEKDATGQEMWTPYSTVEFDKLYEHRKVAIGDKSVSLGKWWREQRRHTHCKGVTFDPRRPSGALPPKDDEEHGDFNLWTGLAVEPAPGDWGLLRDDVIGEVLCDNSTVLHTYVLDWLAFLFQHPERLHRVALAFRGPKGTGKSTLTRALLRALGPHAMKVHEAEQVYGRFNWHMQNKVLVVSEEARWLQGRSHESALKTLITEAETTYEPKGLARVPGVNHVSLILNSNADWVVPASLGDERRFVVSDVSDRRRGDRAFWDAVYRQTDREGGLAAMVHELLRRDIGGFEPWSDAPKTRALADQVMESLDFMARWWHSVLETGEPPNMSQLDYNILSCDIPLTADWREGPVAVSRKALYEDYCAAVPGRYTPRVVNVLGKFLTGFGVRSRQCGAGLQRGERVWVLPQLDEARRIFSSKVGADIFEREDDDIFS